MNFVLMAVVCCQAGISQTVFSERNYRYIDSAEQSEKIYRCKGALTYQENYRKRKLKKDARIVPTLNILSRADFNISQLDVELSKLKPFKVVREEKMNGLIRIIGLLIKGNYSRIEIKLECIDDIVIRRKFMIRSNTYANCSEPPWRMLDFKLLKESFAKEFDFPINRIIDNEYLLAVEINEKNLRIAAEKHKDYKFSFPGPINEKWVNTMLNNQYNNDDLCCYSYNKAERDFVFLIKDEKIGIIVDLLYSPNYFYAVQAMEALIYLASINKIIIDEPMQKRMEIIKQDTFEIIAEGAIDVHRRVNGYKELSVTESAIIRKFKYSVTQSHKLYNY